MTMASCRVLPILTALLALQLWGLAASAATSDAVSIGTTAADGLSAPRAGHRDAGGAAGGARELLSDAGAGKDPATCPMPQVDMTKDRYKCVVWRRACLDQNVIVSYDPDTHPKTSMGDIPALNVSDIMYNIPSKFGIGDRYRKGSALRFPPLYVRPSNDMEEEPQLQDPVFSSCTLPVLLYAHYPYNAAETFRYIFEKLVTLQEAGFFNRHVTLVPGVPPGSRVPSYTQFWYGSLSDRAVVSLSELSARKAPHTPSNATWEGNHVRCFERVVGCRIRYDRYGLRFYNAGQHVVRHYMPHYLARSAEFEERLFRARQVRLPTDPSVFKLVFISRHPDHSAVGRTILNEADLIARCNGARTEDLPPPEWAAATPYKSYFCFAHTFGEDQLMDVWLMRRVDGLVGMHGAGLTNVLYMKPGGSVLEVRPFGFSGRESWANRYARFKASSPAERPWPVHWFGIDTFNASLSEPGMFEKEDKPHFSKFRVIKARDRHVRVTWPSLRHQLLNMAAVARSHERYMALRHAGAFYVTDDVQQAEPPGQDPHVPKAAQRNFTDADAERRAAAALPLNQTALDLATAPDVSPVAGS